MSTGLVSVVIPTYNRAYCISDSVRSVLEQTYDDLEVVVVDDGSSDNTQEVLEGLGDERIRYIRQDNAGACVARNHGVELARGSIVAFHDSDDIWYPHKLELQTDYLKSHSEPCVFCRLESALAEDAQDYRPEAIKIYPSERYRPKDLNLTTLVRGNFVSTQTLMGYRDIFLREPFDPTLPRCQDWDLAIRLMSKGQLGFVDEVLVRQIIRKDSISKSGGHLSQALCLLADKYQALFQDDPLLYALFLRKAAILARRYDPPCSKELFARSLRVRPLPLTVVHRIYAQVLWATDRAY